MAGQPRASPPSFLPGRQAGLGGVDRAKSIPVHNRRLRKKKKAIKSRLTKLLHVLDRKEPLGTRWQGSRLGVDRTKPMSVLTDT